jgi:upstream activation factor subunit UAF30
MSHLIMDDGLQPSDADLRESIRSLIHEVDLHHTGIKSFTKQLSKKYGGIDLKSRAAFIKDTLSEAINEMDPDEEEETREKPKKKPKKPTTKAKEKKEPASSDQKKRKAGKGLSVKKPITPALAAFLQQGEEMARTEIVKALWDYIKDNNLQNPENKREILLDEPMRKVFGCDTFTMFTMNKYIAAHVHPFKEVDLTENRPKESKKRKKRKDEGVTTGKKRRKPKKPGLQPPYRLSEELARVVGKDILPRPQVVTALWDYIKSNNLQVRTLYMHT